jgi:hypothetical protein
VFVENTTPEELLHTHAENPRGLILIKDELTALVNALNQYKGGKGDERQLWLSLWAGAEAPETFVAVAGMLQPDLLPVLRGNLGRRDFLNDGWADRFLYSYPDPLPAVGETWAVVPEDLEAGYCEVFLDLLGLDMVPATEGGEVVGHRPYFVSFDDGACRAWEVFAETVAARKNSLDRDDHYRGVLSKLKHYAVRLSGLFYAVRRASLELPPGAPMDRGCVTRAAEMVAYFDAHARRCFGLGSTDRAIAAARQFLPVLARWPADPADPGDVLSKRNLHRRVMGRAAFQRVEALDGPLAVLQRYGYLRQTIDPEAGPGRPSERYELNPLWDRAPCGGP